MRFLASNLPRYTETPTTPTVKSSIIEHKTDYYKSTIYVIISFLSSLFIYNWSAAEKLLVESRAYEWVCEADILNIAKACDLQKSYLSRFLLPIGLAASVCFSLIGGIFLDIFGPKHTALMGLTLQFCGWLILLWTYTFHETYKNYSMNYIIAIVLLGFGNQPVIFSLISSTNAMVEYKFLITGFIISANAFGVIIPTIANRFMSVKLLNFGDVGKFYCILQVVIMIMTITVLPKKKPKSADFGDETPIHLTEQPKFTKYADSHESLEYRSFMSLPTAIDSTSAQHISYKIAGDMRESRAISKYVPDGTQYYVSYLYKEHKLQMKDHVEDRLKNIMIGEVKNNLFDQASDTKNSQSMSVAHESKASMSREPSNRNFEVVIHNKNENEEDMLSLTSSALTQSQYWRDCSSFWIIEQPEIYFPLFPLAAISILSVTVIESFDSFFGSKSNLALSLFLSSLACIASSICSQFYSPIVMLIVVNTVGWLYFLIIQMVDIFPRSQYITAVLGGFFNSFFLAPIYCFIIKHFPESHFGVLSGLIIMFSGLLSIIATPMCDILSYANDYHSMNVFCLISISVNYLILSYLYRKTRKA